MKKLLAAGETRIFAFARVFRNRERGALHSPEFTMLEWYRAGEPLEALMRDCAEMLAAAAEAAGARALRFRGREADPFAPPERLPVRDAFLEYAGIDLFDSLERRRRAGPRSASPSRPSMRDFASPPTTAGRTSSAASSSKKSSRGSGSAGRYSSPTIPRARRRWRGYRRAIPGSPSASNSMPAAWSSPTPSANSAIRPSSAAVSRRTWQIKARIYGEAYPLDEDFLAALAEMPEASGAALGFDRLVMLACGAERIEDVQWTPVFDPAGSER